VGILNVPLLKRLRERKEAKNKGQIFEKKWVGFTQSAIEVARRRRGGTRVVGNIRERWSSKSRLFQENAWGGGKRSRKTPPTSSCASEQVAPRQQRSRIPQEII